MLTPARVEIEGSGVGDIPSRVIRHDGDVIAYLVLYRPAFERCKRSAYGDVRCPCDAAIRAERIEQLGIGVIRSIARVQPHRIDPSIGGYRQRAKPVPLVVINGIVVNPLWPAKALAAIGAAGEHHVRSATAERLHAGEHVNVIVRGSAGPVNCQEALPG